LAKNILLWFFKNRKKLANKTFSRSPPSLSGGREIFPRLPPLDDSGGSDTPRRLGDGKVSEKLTSADALVTSLSSEPESWSSLSRVGKNPGFLIKKTRPVGFFVFLGFLFFLFFGFFYIFAQKREFLGFFKFQEYF
jgi:hypothetical protein